MSTRTSAQKGRWSGWTICNTGCAIRAQKDKGVVWDEEEYWQRNRAASCAAVDTCRTDGFERFICKIDGVCAGKSPLNEQGRPNSRRLMSALEMTACEYCKTGDVPGKCMTFAGDVK